MGKPEVQKISTSKALFVFSTKNCLRRTLIDYFVLREWFDYFILLTILANCAFLAMTETFDEAEVFFLTIFTLEMVIKVIGLGFIPYIRDPWNKLDFVVVILSFLVYLPQLGNYSAIKAFRVFRAFKSITAVPGLKLMVRALGNCVKKVMYPMLLILFTSVLFAVFGLQMYAGKLKQTCVCVPGYDVDVADFPEFTSHENMTAVWNRNEDNWEPSYAHCSLVSAGRQCPETSEHCDNRAAVNGWVSPNPNLTDVTVQCVEGVGNNPAMGYISFDNFGWAMLTAFQLLTADWWEGVYGPVMMSTTEASVIYFLFSIFLGSFFVLNLVLAVVEGAFEQTKDAEEHEHEEEERLEEAAAASGGGGGGGEGGADGGAGAADADPAALEDGAGGEPAAKYDSSKSVAPWRKKLQWFLETMGFVGAVVILIVGNTLTMALWHPGIIDTPYDDTLEIFNNMFTACFVVEMLLKMVGYGFVNYFTYEPTSEDNPNRSGKMWNRFDCFVVTVSIIEVIILLSGTDGVGGLSILRTFRLMRVLKLGQNWKTMNKLISTLYDSFDELGYLTLIMVIVLYTFAALGMQLFMDDYADLDPDDVPLWNFTDFWHSLMMVFRVLCGEWIEPLHDSLNFSSWPIAIIFFLIVLFVGNFIMINLFLSLLLGAFDNQQELEEEEDALHAATEMMVDDEYQDTTTCGHKLRIFFGWRDKPPLTKAEREKLEVRAATPTTVIGVQPAAVEADGDMVLVSGAGGKAVLKRSSSIKSMKGMNPDGSPAFGPSANGIDAGNGGDDDDDGTSGAKNKVIGIESKSACPACLGTADEAEDVMSNMCCCLPEKVDESLWPVRRFFARVVLSSYFEGVILILIVWSSLMLCWEDVSFRDNQKLFELIEIFNMIFIVAFTTEMTLKMLGFGWYGYFSNGWNVLDFIIVVIGLLSLTLTGGNIKALKALRTLRALRPLRAIRKWEGMKIVVDAMLGSIPAIFNVMIVTFLIFLIFGIVGVQFFGGAFGQCVDGEGERVSYLLVNNRSDCDANDTLEWTNPGVNFDRIDKAMLALFQVATFEGWMAVMQSGVDTRGVEMQPERDANYVMMIYFFVFIVFGSFFTLNLFIGVIIDNFQDRRRLSVKEGKNHGLFVTKAQQAYLDKLRSGLSKKPQKKEDPPTNVFRKAMYDVAGALWFDVSIMIVIGINTIFFAIYHDGQSDYFSMVLWIGNAVFTFIYLLEALIKIIGLGSSYLYLKGQFDAWNIFDFTIMLLSLISVSIDVSSSPVTPWLAVAAGPAAGIVKVLRILRVFRVIRFLRYAPPLRRLVMTLLVSLPALVNIFVVYLLTIFIYAVIGMNLFKDVQQDPTGSINDFENFSSFKKSVLLLFRLSTSAGWDEVADACGIAEPACNNTLYLDPDGNVAGDCGDQTSAQWFFASLVIVVFLVVISAYIAVILDNLTEEEEEDDLEVTPEVIQGYYDVWKHFDPTATSLLDYTKLGEFLEKLPLPLGYPEGVTAEEIAKLEIPCYKSTVTAAFLSLTHKLYDDAGTAAGAANLTRELSATRRIKSRDSIIENDNEGDGDAGGAGGGERAVGVPTAVVPGIGVAGGAGAGAGGGGAASNIETLAAAGGGGGGTPATKPARSISQVKVDGNSSSSSSGTGGGGNSLLKRRGSSMWGKLRGSENSIGPGSDTDSMNYSGSMAGVSQTSEGVLVDANGNIVSSPPTRKKRRGSLISRRTSRSVMLAALSPTLPKLHCADVLNHLIRSKTMLSRDRDARSTASIESTLQLGRAAIFQKFPDYKHLGAPASDTKILWERKKDAAAAAAAAEVAAEAGGGGEGGGSGGDGDERKLSTVPQSPMAAAPPALVD